MKFVQSWTLSRNERQDHSQDQPPLRHSETAVPIRLLSVLHAPLRLSAAEVQVCGNHADNEDAKSYHQFEHFECLPRKLQRFSWTG